MVTRRVGGRTVGRGRYRQRGSALSIARHLAASVDRPDVVTPAYGVREGGVLRPERGGI
jgi:hypothetical protein